MKHPNRIISLFVVILAVGLQACVSVAVQGDHIVSNKNVVFKPNSDTINESFLAIITPSRQILQKVADILTATPDIRRVRIEGHTDATGTAARNQELSTQRAVAVANWLRAHHVTTQFETIGFGSSHPLCTEHTGSCNARNRRVDFVIVERTAPGAGGPPAAASPAPAAH